MPNSLLALACGDLPLPAFLPDATHGVVRGMAAEDLERVGVRALVMNVFHLMQKPGSSTIQALGGLHRMASWPHPIVTDSGGFQAYSLVRQNPKFGKISDQGIRFKPDGADIVICLDDCTHVEDPLAEQEKSVTRTILWAKRCKEEFARQLHQRKRESDSARPLLFGVVQGGGDLNLRRQCADALLEIGFDGYGYGGWPLDRSGKLLTEVLAATRALIPPEFPMHALGVGHPDSIVACVRMGYQIFDCALPTRDARSGRLYIWNAAPDTLNFDANPRWRDTLYIEDDRHIKTDRPLSAFCDCPTCARYSVGYLRHLFKAGDTLYMRLATQHNLRFMTRLMERLRDGTD
jgi:queuine tRNA-ribosyltransferase